jgi:formylglycine-generating enzyme required for sulfatase activity
MKTLPALLLAITPLCAEPITNPIGMKLVPIAPGSFLMGQDEPASDYKLSKHPEKFDDAEWDEKPAHRVTITQPFLVGATEVTLARYRAMDADFRAGEKESDAAVGGISWNQAVKFCEWLSAKEGKTWEAELVFEDEPKKEFSYPAKLTTKPMVKGQWPQ